VSEILKIDKRKKGVLFGSKSREFQLAEDLK